MDGLNMPAAAISLAIGLLGAMAFLALARKRGD